MPIVIRHSELGRGGLCLKLTNQLGQAQDAASVLWCVVDQDGTPVSGRLQAVRRSVGDYYAPWRATARQGTYTIVWSVTEQWDSAPVEHRQSFAVVDAGNFPASGEATITRGLEQAVGVYLTGSVLGRGDMPLFLRDQSGYLADAYAVFWTVYDRNGCTVSARAAASHAATGEYYASWSVSSATGDYIVRWEWQETADSPLQSRDAGVSVVWPYAMPAEARVSAAARNDFAGSTASASACSPLAASGSSPMPSGPFPVEQRVILSENGGASDTVVIPHTFGHAPVVYVLKFVSGTWVDAVGTVDVVHDSGFTTVTVTNTTAIALDLLIRLAV